MGSSFSGGFLIVGSSKWQWSCVLTVEPERLSQCDMFFLFLSFSHIQHFFFFFFNFALKWKILGGIQQHAFHRSVKKKKILFQKILPNSWWFFFSPSFVTKKKRKEKKLFVSLKVYKNYKSIIFPVWSQCHCKKEL